METSTTATKPEADNRPQQPELLDESVMPEGWELLLTRAQKEARPGRYTLERIQQDEDRLKAIIAALGAGFSARDVVRALHVHHRVVAGILGQYHEAIDALKKRAQTKMLRTAELCVDFFREQLLAGDVSARDASIAGGIFLDKGLLLAGEPTVITSQAPTGQRNLEELNRYIASLPGLEVTEVKSVETEKESDVKPPKAQ
jgi:hypothetical protein